MINVISTFITYFPGVHLKLDILRKFKQQLVLCIDKHLSKVAVDKFWQN